MSMETALRSRLLNDATVAGITGTRVDWTERPQMTALPAVTLQVISDPRPQTFSGFTGFRETRVQIDCWGLTRGAVVALREAVIAAVAPAGTFYSVNFGRSFFPTGGIDRGENTETGFVHRDSIDALVWHNA